MEARTHHLTGDRSHQNSPFRSHGKTPQSGLQTTWAAWTTFAAIALAAGVAIIAAAPPVQAAWKPTKPIQFIVMAGKGGGADKAVRFLSKLMKTYRPDLPDIKVVNVSGRSGADALKSIDGLKGDAHTLMFTLNSFYTAPLNYPDIGVDISKLTPIGRLANDTFVLWVHSDRADIKTFEDFLKAARAKGKDWTMSGTGTGGEDNLLTDFLNTQYALNMTYVARKGGGAVAKDLAEKRADSTVNNPAEQSAFHSAGTTKPIVAITPKRLQQYLRTPTLKETGMSFHYFMQRSVVAPEAMPEQARVYYVELFEDIFKGPEWQGYRKKNSLQGDFITGNDLREFWVAEKEKHARWRMSLELLRP